MSEGQLAKTGLGAGTVTVFGFAVGEVWLLAVAAAMVVTGVVLLRLTWRRDSPAGS
ncbi:hypothetical protein AB0C68_30760 [Streptomyces tendae]|uniref:hypothetical protein n=1 Tax=Streptomyces TaxID=1883 RepID=UPI001170C356|nr:hypothetical protein [Streptomyces sp. CS113]